MVSFRSDRGQDRYKKGQKYHPVILNFLEKSGWEILGPSTEEEDMKGIDYWVELPKKMWRWFPKWKGERIPVSTVDFKVMFGDRLGVQDRMKNGEVDGYLFARVFPKNKEIRLSYIRKVDFWNHPRLHKAVNKDGEHYSYIHSRFAKTIHWYSYSKFPFNLKDGEPGNAAKC